jgi:hypothetical protein
MPNHAPILIDDELAAFMQGGISLNLASRSLGMMPSVARALGCRVTDGCRSVRILVSQQQAAQVLADVRETGMLAVVVSEPSSHRTYQLKGGGARIEAPGSEDLMAVHGYRVSFPAHLEKLGYPPLMIRTFLSCPDEDVVAVVFSPEAVFSQTPGSNAGCELKGRP